MGDPMTTRHGAEGSETMTIDDIRRRIEAHRSLLHQIPGPALDILWTALNLAERARDYAVDTGECVFCGREDGGEHDDHCIELDAFDRAIMETR